MFQLSDEKVARQYMEEMRWGSEPFCPHCNSTKPYKLKDGKTYRCSNKSCKKDFTVTVKTIFENSKVSIATWMCAIYLITAHKKGISSHQLARDLGITQKTAWFVTHRVRLIMGEPAPEPFEGITEVDETYCGGKFSNMNRGRRKHLQDNCIDNKTALMGIVQRQESVIVERPNKIFPDKIVKEKVITKPGKVKLIVIGANTFKEVVRENVDKSAVIVSDSHLGYIGLATEYTAHLSVNHSRSEYRNGLAYTNTVEGFFSSLKRSIYGIYHSVSPKHLHRYCEETSFRYNHRKISDKDRFNMTLQNVEGRIKYKDLISNK